MDWWQVIVLGFAASVGWAWVVGSPRATHTPIAALLVGVWAWAGYGLGPAIAGVFFGYFGFMLYVLVLTARDKKPGEA